jgi:hypothetical protein
MKYFIGLSLIVIAVAILGIGIGVSIYAGYQYNNQIGSYWSLADKASTINQKSEYIDKFVEALKDAHLNGTNDTLWLATPDKSFDQNFKALLSLQARLKEIKTMDPSSFQYQTAIEQITAQEQGGAQPMLTNFENCWFKINHHFLWNNLELGSTLIGLTILIIIGIVVIAV